MVDAMSVEGDVLFAEVLFGVEMGLLLDGGSHGGALEAFPDDVDGEVGGVGHFLVEEAVVAEFVEDDFVGWEVAEGVEFRILGDELVDGEEEGAFAELVVVGAVGEVADGADGEEDVEMREESVEVEEEGLP